MSNDYFNKTGVPATSAALASAAMRSEIAAIEDGFAKLPALGGNDSNFVVINAGGTAQTSLTAAQARVAMGVAGIRSVQKFTASGTYTPTGGTLFGLVYIKGGGGSGGSGTLSQGRGGGGGEGEEAWKLVSAATIGASQIVTIGAGGAVQTINTNANGNAGGTSSFGAIVTAVGGSGGGSGNTAGTGGAGGTGGSGGDYAMPGAPGTCGTDVTASVCGLHANGGGKGGSIFDGGSGVANSGGGGGPGYASSASGSGGKGICIVYEYF